ncbi:MAG TPA: MBL fold metallo-hydrolase [Myxococcota bacterium]|nr:MBL fold metallo-hydrolase [Myxococcota bacterium]
MAKRSLRLPGNVPGDFYVDSTCIDCDTCRWMAPETFGELDEQSVVQRQPATEEEVARAMTALISCPTASIGMLEKRPLAPYLALFPLPVDGEVHHCGFHHESSFGAASYLVVRPEGNVLVDSPRFAGPLVQRIEALGGVKTLFLTHQDDVADHQRFRDHFGCERVLHADDARGALRSIERRIEGVDEVALDDDLLVIPTPGHTRGSACLLYRGTYLFTGDHLAWSEERGHVYAFRSACWYDWGVQIESMKRLANHDFEWVLPGHGRRCRFERVAMRGQMARAIAWMEERR